MAIYCKFLLQVHDHSVQNMLGYFYLSVLVLMAL